MHNQQLAIKIWRKWMKWIHQVGKKKFKSICKKKLFSISPPSLPIFTPTPYSFLPTTHPTLHFPNHTLNYLYTPSLHNFMKKTFLLSITLCIGKILRKIPVSGGRKTKRIGKNFQKREIYGNICFKNPENGLWICHSIFLLYIEKRRNRTRNFRKINFLKFCNVTESCVLFTPDIFFPLFIFHASQFYLSELMRIN